MLEAGLEHGSVCSGSGLHSCPRSARSGDALSMLHEAESLHQLCLSSCIVVFQARRLSASAALHHAFVATASAPDLCGNFRRLKFERVIDPVQPHFAWPQALCAPGTARECAHEAHRGFFQQCQERLVGLTDSLREGRLGFMMTIIGPR